MVRSRRQPKLHRTAENRAAFKLKPAPVHKHPLNRVVHRLLQVRPPRKQQRQPVLGAAGAAQPPPVVKQRPRPYQHGRHHPELQVPAFKGLKRAQTLSQKVCRKDKKV